MPLYELTHESILPVKTIQFSAVGLKERSDLQRLLREKIDVVSPDTLIVSEEFGEWEDSRRRIDLLGVDSSANLVVIELKRTEDGGHMDLQAIRYSAMISTLTFERVVEVFEDHLRKNGNDEDARSLLLAHLDWSSPDDGEFAPVVRIVLVAADFSKEITTAVLWLNEQGLDIRCVRFTPYQLNEKLLVDVQQLVPLPEASDYIIQIREKRQEVRRARSSQEKDFSKYILTLGNHTTDPLNKRRTMLEVFRHLVGRGLPPETIVDTFPTSAQNRRFLSFPGTLDADGVTEAFAEVLRQGKKVEFKRYFTDQD